MTPLDTLRDRARAALDSDTGNDPSSETAPIAWWPVPAAGALSAAASWLVLALPALVVWVATPHTTVSWGQALGVASAGWFLGHGASVSVDPVSLSVAPLGVWLLALTLTARRARRLLDATGREAPGTTWAHRLGRRILPGFVLGYAGFAAVAWLLTLAGPARPHPLGVVVVLAVPALALGWVLLRRHLAGEEAGVAGDGLGRLPRWLPRAAPSGVVGIGVLLLVGTLLVAGMVVARWPTVAGLHAAVGADAVGGAVLTAAQLLVLPNLAVWAVAWLAGPGFQIADGSAITLAGAHPGLMPMVPALGALPSEGVWSPWLVLVISVPVLVGTGIGWLACRSLARLSSWRTKLASAATAAATSAVGMAILAALGSGSAGVDRLRSVGTSPLLLGAALLGELLAGAAAYVLAVQLRLRLRTHR